MHIASFLSAAFCIVCLVAGVGYADVIECGPTCISADASVWTQFPDRNYGVTTFLAVGEESGYLWRTFLRFDLSCCGIPSGATIQQATLKLRATQLNGSGPYQMFASQVLTSWVEGTITANNAPSSGTYLDDSYLNEATNWVEFDVTSAVQAWWATPASNYGFALAGFAPACFFPSSEQSGWDDYKPRLIVTFQRDQSDVGVGDSTMSSLLLTCTPNPIISEAQLQFCLLASEDVQIRVFDVLGREVWNRAVSGAPSGVGVVRWDCMDLRGRRVVPGIYLVEVQTNSIGESLRIVVAK